jgi:cytochrome c551
MASRRALLVILGALALAVPAAGCGGGDEPTASDEPASGAAADGQQVFADNCASCHGEDGSGGVGPTLQNPELTSDEVSTQVTEGGDGMPAFGGELDEAEIADVTAYVTEELAGQ